MICSKLSYSGLYIHKSFKTMRLVFLFPDPRWPPNITKLSSNLWQVWPYLWSTGSEDLNIDHLYISFLADNKHTCSIMAWLTPPIKYRWLSSRFSVADWQNTGCQFFLYLYRLQAALFSYWSSMLNSSLFLLDQTWFFEVPLFLLIILLRRRDWNHIWLSVHYFWVRSFR